MMFNEILDILLGASGSSVQEFANAIMYERSYISKWLSDSALPSLSGWRETKGSIARFLDSRLTGHDMAYLAIQYPYIQMTVQEDVTRSKLELISALLEKSYARTIDRDEIRKRDPEKNLAVTYTGVRNVVDYLISFLTQDTHTSSEDACFYYMGDIVRCFNDEILDRVYVNYMNPGSLRVKSTLDLDRLSRERGDSLKYITLYFHLLSALPFLNLEIFQSAGETASLVQMAKNGSMAAWGFELEDGVPDVLFVLEDETSVSESCQRLGSFFEAKQPVWSLQEDFGKIFAQKGETVTDTTPILYVPRMYLYFASNEFREQQLQEHYITMKEYEMWGRLQTVLSRPEIRKARILVPRTTFNDTFTRGWIYKSNGGQQLFGREFRRYMDDLFNILPRENIVILENETVTNFRYLPTAIIYSDRQNSFALHFNQFAPYKTENIMYQSLNSLFTALVYDWLEAVMNIEQNDFLR